MKGGRGARRRLALGAIAGSALAAAALALAAAAAIRGSLPVEEGEVRLAGLSAAVTVERDALGVPTIRARSLRDVAMAIGFVHSEERFFQMDLMRRASAGELAEIAGEATLAMDRGARIHRFRHRARAVLAMASEEERDLLEAYADGVNAGIAIGSRPPEYVVLRVDPEPWKPEDTILVLFSMFLDLTEPIGAFESAQGCIEARHPAEAAAFLSPPGCEWDAPVEGEPFATGPIPGPGVLDLDEAGSRRAGIGREPAGSNGWVVAGSRSAHGGAILASDMHLGLGVPNTWFRAVLEWQGRRVAGVTLPGAPAVVAGTNGDVAWGFTNSQGDWVDLVVVEEKQGDPSRYATARGYLEFERITETIDVKGGRREEMEIVSTIWGPVFDRDEESRPRALRWTGHDAEAANLGIMRMAEVRSVGEALDVAPLVGIPAQNMVVADAQGHIGWTIAGRIPRRVGFDGRVPVSWADGSCRWDGYLTPGEYPRIEDPASGFIWTANARVVGGEDLAKIGDGGFVLGARARQIRDSLIGRSGLTERDMLAIQLDTRAILLSRWRDLLAGLLDDDAARSHPRRAALRSVLEKGWTGRASVGSAAYRIVRAFRLDVFSMVYPRLTDCPTGDLTQWEGPLWRIVTERPAHLLPPGMSSWREALLAAADATLESLPDPLADRTWGERNTSAIRHPLSLGAPLLSRWLDMPGRELPGDSNMPRVITPDFGASERLVVSPGREESGIFHMPCGQSGHPLSPHYKDGHEAWENGDPTPFLPGKTVKILVLVP